MKKRLKKILLVFLIIIIASCTGFLIYASSYYHASDDALQYLTNLASQREGCERIRIMIDVEDYRKRRADTLEQLALRLADRVKKSGDRVVLEPMTPHERKIIHMSLQNESGVETYSEGLEPFRRVVIVARR